MGAQLYIPPTLGYKASKTFLNARLSVSVFTSGGTTIYAFSHYLHELNNISCHYNTKMQNIFGKGKM